MPPDALRLLRITITLQVLITAWFLFSPDLRPDYLTEIELKNDRPLYAILDSILVPLGYLQTLLCLALWQPSRWISWSYLSVAVIAAVLGSFAGPVISSAIDNFFGYVQVLASGAMLCLLHTHRILDWRKIAA